MIYWIFTRTWLRIRVKHKDRSMVSPLNSYFRPASSSSRRPPTFCSISSINSSRHSSALADSSISSCCISVYIYRSTIFVFNWWWRRIAVYDFDTLWILGRVSFLHVRWNSLTQFHFKNNWLDSTNVIRKKKTIQWRILTIH